MRIDLNIGDYVRYVAAQYTTGGYIYYLAKVTKEHRDDSWGGVLIGRMDEHFGNFWKFNLVHEDPIFSDDKTLEKLNEEQIFLLQLNGNI